MKMFLNVRAGVGALTAALLALPATAQDALIGHWISGPTNLADAAGYLAPGTVDGVAAGTPANLAWSADLPPGYVGGRSLSLDGTVAVQINNTRNADPGYVNLFDDGIASRVSISVWAKGWPGQWGPWVSKRGEGNQGWQVRRLGTGNYPTFTIRGTPGADDPGTSLACNDGNWHHYAGVWDGSAGTRKLYVDGADRLGMTGDTGPMALATTSSLMLGARDNAGALQSYFNGLLYDVRIYNYAITSNQVAALFVPSTAKAILTFDFPGMGSATIVDTNILLNVPMGTGLTNLAPTYTMSGRTGSPISGSTNDFTRPVTYTITADNGSTADYLVTVTTNAATLYAFTFGDYGPAAIAGTNVTKVLPDFVNLTNLAPTYAIPLWSTGSPPSGATLDFTTSQTYSVTAEDGVTAADYLVTVTTAPVGPVLTNVAGGDWSSFAVWGDGLPPYPLGSAQYIIDYVADKYAGNSVNNLSSNFLLNRLNFGAAVPGVTLSGNSLAFTNNGVALPQVTQSNAGLVRVVNAVVLAATTTVSIAGNGSLAIVGAISGDGGLTKDGDGALTLSGTNSYGGNTAINAGTLVASTPGALPGYDLAGKVTAAGSGILAVLAGGAGWAAGDLDTLLANAAFAESTASLAIDTSSGDFTYNSAVNGNLGLVKLGANTLTLGGVSGYNGGTRIQGGTLMIAGSGQLGSGAYAGDISIASGATFNYGSSAGQTIHGNITGGGALIKTGASTLTLAGTNNTYAGETFINGGTLSAASLPYNNSIAFNNDGVLEFTGVSSSGTFYLDTAPGRSGSGFAINVTDPGGNVRVNRGQYIAGMSYNSITKSGSGTLTVANAGTQDGGSVTVNAGTLISAGATAYNVAYNNISQVNDVLPGATLKLGTGAPQGQFNAINGNGPKFHMSGGTYDLNGNTANSTPVLDGAGFIINNASGTTAQAQMFVYGDETFSGDIQDGAGRLAVTVGYGANYGGTPTGKTWTLSGANTYSGPTTVALGNTLKAGSPTAFSPNSAFTVGNNCSLDLAGFNNTIAGLAGSGTVSNSVVGTAILSVSNDLSDCTFGGVFKYGTGVIGLTKRGSKTLTLTGPNSYTGDTKVLGGTLSLSQACLADGASVYLTTGAKIELNFSGTDTIATLYIDGRIQKVGTHGATDSGAQFINDNVFSGSGTLTVTTGIPVSGAVMIVR